MEYFELLYNMQMHINYCMACFEKLKRFHYVYIFKLIKIYLRQFKISQNKFKHD